MILTLIKLDSTKHLKSFDVFAKLAAERYSEYLSTDLVPYDNRSWYTAVKPYHAGIFPFFSLDMLIQCRGLPCKFFFGHDLLTFGNSVGAVLNIDAPLRAEIDRILKDFPMGGATMRFRGFGNRIDIGLNALSNHYCDILGTLTKVESEVLGRLRALQFQKHGTPMNVRTFGLQKKVAGELGKSPVAIHKSLRSAKYGLVADTARAMKGMMV